MTGILPFALKAGMFGVFATWVYRHRADTTPENTPTTLDTSFVDRLLLFSLVMFAALAVALWIDPSDTGHAQAVFYPVSLGLTLLLECSMAALMGYRSMKELGCVALCSLVTHPTLHLVAFLPDCLFGEDLFEDHWSWFLEMTVVVAESWLLNRLLPYRRADNAKLALAMNAFSFLGGLAIVMGLWWILG